MHIDEALEPLPQVYLLSRQNGRRRARREETISLGIYIRDVVTRQQILRPKDIKGLQSLRQADGSWKGLPRSTVQCQAYLVSKHLFYGLHTCDLSFQSSFSYVASSRVGSISFVDASWNASQLTSVEAYIELEYGEALRHLHSPSSLFSVGLRRVSRSGIFGI